eukprot:366485-Chlamydomonas_euryale.AAC.8
MLSCTNDGSLGGWGAVEIPVSIVDLMSCACSVAADSVGGTCASSAAGAPCSTEMGASWVLSTSIASSSAEKPVGIACTEGCACSAVSVADTGSLSDTVSTSKFVAVPVTAGGGFASESPAWTPDTCCAQANQSNL